MPWLHPSTLLQAGSDFTSVPEKIEQTVNNHPAIVFLSAQILKSVICEPYLY